MPIVKLRKKLFFSIQKNVKNVKGFFFKRTVLNKWDLSQKTNKSNEDLDKIFKDNRSEYTSQMSKIRHIALKILSIIEHITDETNTDYFLAYGTLLGAIRHKDFIPWDDDIDIMMTKSDFNVFLENLHLLPASVTVLPVEYNFVKIMDKYSKISIDGKRGVAVDIFIINENQGLYNFVNVHTQKEILLTKMDLYPIKKSTFGDHLFSTPNNSGLILETIYGDYMKLPPIEKRVSTHTNDTSIKILPIPKMK